MSVLPNTQQTLTATGYIAPTPGTFALNAAAPLTVSVPLPAADGIRLRFVDISGKAHLVKFDTGGSPPSSGLSGGTRTTATFSGTSGVQWDVESSGGSWWGTASTGIVLS
jgi:hypothetical protein